MAAGLGSRHAMRHSLIHAHMTKDYRILALLVLVLLIGMTAFFVPDMLARKKLERAKQNVIENSARKYEMDVPVAVDKEAEEYRLVETNEYSIVYQKKFDVFIISVTGTPFEQVREKAEQEFLSLTQSTERTACRLNVKIGTPFFANPDLAGKNFPLSFCE